MDHDDDVEHLFSWLQTPELRYREFAGAREITDSVVIVQQRRADNSPVPEDRPVDAPPHNTQLNEEYPDDQFPDQGETRVEMLAEVSPPSPRPAVPDRERIVVREEAKVEVDEQIKITTRGDTARVVIREEEEVDVREEARGAGRGPLIIAPMPIGNEAAADREAGLFGLGAAGRNSLRSGPAEWAGPRPPLIQTPAAREATPPMPQRAPAAQYAPPRQTAPTRPIAPEQARGLLGGAYRDNGPNGANGNGADMVAPEEPAASAQGAQRSLDAVFGRLSEGRGRLPDPRERLRHIPGLGPPAGRPR